MRKYADWGSAIVALLMIMGCSFLGTFVAGLALLLIFGLV